MAVREQILLKNRQTVSRCYFTHKVCTYNHRCGTDALILEADEYGLTALEPIDCPQAKYMHITGFKQKTTGKP